MANRRRRGEERKEVEGRERVKRRGIEKSEEHTCKGE